MVGWVERSEPHHRFFAGFGGARYARPTLQISDLPQQKLFKTRRHGVARVCSGCNGRCSRTAVVKELFGLDPPGMYISELGRMSNN
jgi:hypothetical protein